MNSRANDDWLRKPPLHTIPSINHVFLIIDHAFMGKLDNFCKLILSWKKFVIMMPPTRRGKCPRIGKEE